MHNLHNRRYSEFKEDAIRVETSTRIIGCQIVDSTSSPAAHRDAIQLIPPHQGKRLQFAGAELGGVKIYGNRISSNGKLQCIFMSDGIARDVRIIGNTLDTRGQHYISLAGLLDGWIEGNIRPDGGYAPILLDPVRLAGDQNVYILSFKDKNYAYPPLTDLIDADTLAAGVVRDRRAKIFDPTATYLNDFDLTGFRRAYASASFATDISGHTQGIKTLALRFGHRVYEI